MMRLTRRDDIEIEKITSKLQLPRNLTRFLYMLPHQTNVTISSELFVERLRKLVLPLRPSDNASMTNDRGGNVRATVGGDNRRTNYYDNDDDMDIGNTVPIVEDLFKQRAKKRLDEMQQFPVST